MANSSDFPKRVFLHLSHMLLDIFFSIDTLALTMEDFGYSKGEVDQIRFSSLPDGTQDNELFMHHYLYYIVSSEYNGGVLTALDNPLVLVMVLREMINETGGVEEHIWNGFLEIRGQEEEHQPILCRLFFEHYLPACAKPTFSLQLLEVSDSLYQGKWSSAECDEDLIREIFEGEVEEYRHLPVVPSRLSIYDNGKQVEVGRSIPKERELVEPYARIAQ